ncbi:hypothetical protein B9Z19DRAFT_1133363 [Tuber borchii]|uniref:Uncharacterized protein n=1 Tax=Tuber borchii TaxID=42251 RepID=A0A2T6ZG04_TUBBO|nr:hypothetical protein B9Z19DRAFT_1133363 [Tuber borchii]
MIPTFIRPACRLALRPGTRAYCLNSPKLSAHGQAHSTQGHAARSSVDQSSISEEILQMRTDIAVLQEEVKYLRGGLFKTKMNKFMESVKKPFRGMSWTESPLYLYLGLATFIFS